MRALIQSAAGFHGITAVAELKGRPRAVRPAARVAFPRHHSRGRIEGSNAAHLLNAAPRFPRHHSRGRIEGTFQMSVPSTAAVGFHGITAVAELKELTWEL